MSGGCPQAYLEAIFFNRFYYIGLFNFKYFVLFYYYNVSHVIK